MGRKVDNLGLAYALAQRRTPETADRFLQDPGDTLHTDTHILAGGYQGAGPHFLENADHLRRSREAIQQIPYREAELPIRASCGASGTYGPIDRDAKDFSPLSISNGWG